MPPPSDVPLPARTSVAGLAALSVAAASRAAARVAGVAEGEPDPQRIAVAYSSERWFRIDGLRPNAFAPLSGFFRTRDGWVRTHGNYPHHAAVLRAQLGLAADADCEAAALAFASTDAAAISARIQSAGGLCVVVGGEQPRLDRTLRSQALVEVHRLGAGSPVALPGAGDARQPLQGVRVLDLTRVIAGPVGTRVLALLGADVLRIDPPRLPEIEWQHLDTGHGKRSALLDLAAPADRRAFDELLADADVIALGYRPAALARLGLTPEALAARRPGIVVLQHSAWPDPARRGFDSLVQAECGIAFIEGSAGQPGALPAQALDHSTGYLMAAAAITLLERRSAEGGSWLARTSLRRVAAELLGMPRTPEPRPDGSIDPSGRTQHFVVDGHEITTSGPAIAYAGAPSAYPPPRPWGRDEPVWR
ncbi:CoA transferase [Microbacterium fluvii]|uniref:CoA transferase n=1 Tax=Microbacterium fluvii TaxID=415215 RepID=A0ABW2HHB7_9MICO|nr:CoA transferase [Microbacterium fluvii]MCU4673546.1 CoA transferase [Microbacterium fluvii]